MRCPKCEESMKSDVKEKKYDCGSCGNEIKWVSDERDNEDVEEM